MLRCFFLSLLFISLAACSTWSKHNFIKRQQQAYLHSQTVAPLRVPSGLSAERVSDDYPIPTLNQPAPTKPIGLLPPDSLAEQIATGKVSRDVLKHSGKMNVGTVVPVISGTQAKGNNLILSLNQAASQNWKPMVNALNRMGYRVLVQNQSDGVIYILDTPGTQYKATRDTAIYLVHLRDTDQGSEVYLTDEANKSLNSTVTLRIFKDITDGLAGKSASSLSREWEYIKKWASELI